MGVCRIRERIGLKDLLCVPYLLIKRQIKHVNHKRPKTNTRERDIESQIETCAAPADAAERDIKGDNRYRIPERQTEGNA